ncbi:MAG TPA: glycosyltransferase [Paracoccaceae bacterium]|nr:glycosyltransferase [Paracoccaceae bacterium]
MRIAWFTHSLVSDWNHGNAHFLRGVLAELAARGHDCTAWEPEGGWSRTNLRREAPEAEAAFARRFPTLVSRTYAGVNDLDRALDGADLVVVHEWTEPEIVAEIGRRRAGGARFTLLFHDTHHRAVSSPGEMAGFDLSAYDGVLAFGEALRDVYLARGWGRRVWTWHEAADTGLFHPQPETSPEGDIVWIGNWGDDERTSELDEFLIGPARRAGASLDVHGVRYPQTALDRLAAAGARYHGWLANADVPQVFARHRMTMHVPRRWYVTALPGVPTIRVFEALACGIALISAPWDDAEGLFRPGSDFQVARDEAEAERHIRTLRHDAAARAELAASGLQRIRARHSCAHRVDELLDILAGLAPDSLRQKEGTPA